MKQAILVFVCIIGLSTSAYAVEVAVFAAGGAYYDLRTERVAQWRNPVNICGRTFWVTDNSLRDVKYYSTKSRIKVFNSGRTFCER